MRAALVGGSGLLGRRVLARWPAGLPAPRLLWRAGAGAAPAGPQAVVGDLFDPDALARLLAGCDTVVHLATALRTVAGQVDWRANDRVRREGTHALLRAARVAGVRRVVQLGIAFVDGGEQPSDGLGPLAPLPQLRSAADQEAELASAGLPALLLRSGLFWGPGTSLQAWAVAQRGEHPPPSLARGADDWVSLVHLDDMADAVLAGMCSQAVGTWVVVDGRPRRWRELMAPSAAARPGLGVLPSFRIPADRVPPAASPPGWRARHDASVLRL